MLDVTLDPTGGYRCKDAVSHEVQSGEEAMRVYADGCKQRAIASTKMNSGMRACNAHMQWSAHACMAGMCPSRFDSKRRCYLRAMHVRLVRGCEEVDRWKRSLSRYAAVLSSELVHASNDDS